MISSHTRQPQASYDDDGNIVIRVQTSSAPVEAEKQQVHTIPLIQAEPAKSAPSDAVWETVEEEFIPTSKEDVVQEERLVVRTRFRAV